MTFRNLYPTEIQVRPTDTKYKGSCTLLLYQDARCGMDILDETIGSDKWQKEYYEVKGNVYCKIGILTDNGWVWKADCGMESNVDAAKGEASDAFKRACVSWGIGRELYSGPRIKIDCPDKYYYNDKLSMTFYVQSIKYEGKTITEITICDRFNKVVFDWDCNNGVKPQNKPTESVKEASNTPTTLERLKAFCSEKKGNTDKDRLLRFFNYYKNWKGNKIDFEEKWKTWS